MGGGGGKLSGGAGGTESDGNASDASSKQYDSHKAPSTSTVVCVSETCRTLPACHSMHVGTASSIFESATTEIGKRRHELQMEILGTQGLGWENADDATSFTETELTATRTWLRSKATSIESGTSEIQLNIIAKRVLGLPD